MRKYSAIGLCILVAIPLPGTGAWTGALVAAVLDMRLKSAIPSIFLGVCIAAAHYDHRNLRLDPHFLKILWKKSLATAWLLNRRDGRKFFWMREAF